MASMILVVDTAQRPLSPCHPARARRLLSAGKAAVWRHDPFTSILKRAVLEAQPAPQPLRLTLDPGSRATGLALVHEASGPMVWAAELAHRGQRIHAALLARRALRRSRRQRQTRYRPRRLRNRRRAEGWLPPSLESRMHTALTWVARLRRYAPVGALSQELVRVATQLLDTPAIRGVVYQQGELAGYEVRAYLLQTFHRRCAYCATTGVGLQIEPLVPTARGGTNRMSNLVLACGRCNIAKGARTAAEWGYPAVQAQASRPLQDTAAVNASRWALYRRLLATGLPVEVGTGGRTTWKRTRRGLPTAQWIDAACAGASTPERLMCRPIALVHIRAMGRHSRQRCRTNASSFPDKAPKATSVVAGMRTGDLVRAVVPAPSSKTGVYVGRLAVRATGSCTITTSAGTVQGILIRSCRPLHRGDGYTYEKGEAARPPAA